MDLYVGAFIMCIWTIVQDYYRKDRAKTGESSLLKLDEILTVCCSTLWIDNQRRGLPSL
jgi:hypothetical protein